MAKEAKDRYPNCTDFAKAFHQSVADMSGAEKNTGFFTFSLPKAPTPTPSGMIRTGMMGNNPPTPYGNTPYPTPQPYGTPQPYNTPPPQYGTPYPPTYTSPKKKGNSALWIVMALVVAVIGVGGAIVALGGNNSSVVATETPTSRPAVVIVQTDTPTATNTDTPTATNSATPTLSSDQRAATQNAQAQATIVGINTLTAEAESLASTLQARIESTTIARIATQTASAPTVTPTSTSTDTPTLTVTPSTTPSATNTPRPSPTPTNTVDERGTRIAEQFYATQTAFARTQTPLSLPATATPAWQNQVSVTRVPYQCDGTAPSFFAVGDMVRLTPVGSRNRVRQSPTVNSAQVDFIELGGLMTLLEGPICENSIVWWRIDWNGIRGWTAESAAGDVWLEAVDLTRFQVGAYVTVYTNDQGLEMRDEASVNSRSVQTLRPGTRVQIIGGPVEAGGYTWWHVLSSTQTGWAVQEADGILTLVP
jgi:flagellar basal body-associated protein FliL